MTKREATRLAKEISAAGFTVTGYRHYSSPRGSWAIDAEDRATGTRIVINSREQWTARCKAVAYAKEYGA